MVPPVAKLTLHLFFLPQVYLSIHQKSTKVFKKHLIAVAASI